MSVLRATACSCRGVLLLLLSLPALQRLTCCQRERTPVRHQRRAGTGPARSLQQQLCNTFVRCDLGGVGLLLLRACCLLGPQAHLQSWAAVAQTSFLICRPTGSLKRKAVRPAHHAGRCCFSAMGHHNGLITGYQDSKPAESNSMPCALGYNLKLSCPKIQPSFALRPSQSPQVFSNNSESSWTAAQPLMR